MALNSTAHDTREDRVLRGDGGEIDTKLVAQEDDRRDDQDGAHAAFDDRGKHAWYFLAALLAARRAQDIVDRTP